MMCDVQLRKLNMEQSMSQSMATSTPTNDVDALIRQVADANNLEYISQAEQAPSAMTGTLGSADVNKTQPEKDLDRRLAQLRN